MGAPSVMHGARGKVGIYNTVTGKTDIVGIFSSCDYGLNYNVQPAYILGRCTAAAIEYVDVEVVSVTCSGFRVVGHGPHVDAGMPTIQKLLTAGYITLTLIDRQTEQTGGDPRIAKFSNVKCTGYSTGMQTRSLSNLTVTYMATIVSDESADNSEGPLPTNLP